MRRTQLKLRTKSLFSRLLKNHNSLTKYSLHKAIWEPILAIKMMGSFLSRLLIMTFGYAYPAYECFKIVEKNKPEIEQLLSWSKYWILVAVITVLERIGDVFLCWLPFYSEAKLALFIYLWSYQMKGTIYVYSRLLRPFMKQHESEIDRNISELRSKAISFAFYYWKKALDVGQTTFFDILQTLSSPHNNERH